MRTIEEYLKKVSTQKDYFIGELFFNDVTIAREIGTARKREKFKLVKWNKDTLTAEFYKKKERSDELELSSTVTFASSFPKYDLSTILLFREMVRPAYGGRMFYEVSFIKDYPGVYKKGQSFYSLWQSDDCKTLVALEERNSMPSAVYIDEPSSKDPLDRHPLESVFADVLDQVTKGKGSERHGETEGGKGLTFSEQPIMTITRYVGNGYPLGQAMKKLSEVPALMKHKGRDAAYKEILGAIAYAAAAALYLKED